jgi:hypothetical protein
VTQNAVRATESVEGEAVRPATIEPVGRRGQVDSTSVEDTQSDDGKHIPQVTKTDDAKVHPVESQNAATRTGTGPP